MRDAREDLGLRLALEDVHDGRFEDQEDHDDQEGREQRPALVSDHRAKQGERRRVTGQLEEPQHPQHAQRIHRDGDDEGQQSREHGEEIDEPDERGGVVKTGAPGLSGSDGFSLGCGPEAQDVLDGHRRHGEGLDQAEEPREPRGKVFDRLDHRGHDAHEDEGYERPVGKPVRPRRVLGRG